MNGRAGDNASRAERQTGRKNAGGQAERDGSSATSADQVAGGGDAHRAVSERAGRSEHRGANNRSGRDAWRRCRCVDSEQAVLFDTGSAAGSPYLVREVAAKARGTGNDAGRRHRETDAEVAGGDGVSDRSCKGAGDGRRVQRHVGRERTADATNGVPGATAGAANEAAAANRATAAGDGFHRAGCRIAQAFHNAVGRRDAAGAGFVKEIMRRVAVYRRNGEAGAEGRLDVARAGRATEAGGRSRHEIVVPQVAATSEGDNAAAGVEERRNRSRSAGDVGGTGRVVIAAATGLIGSDDHRAVIGHVEKACGGNAGVRVHIGKGDTKRRQGVR